MISKLLRSIFSIALLVVAPALSQTPDTVIKAKPGDTVRVSVGRVPKNVLLQIDTAPSAPVPPTPNTVLFTEEFENTSFSSRGWYDNTTAPLSTVEKHSGNSSIQVRWNTSTTAPFGAMRKLFTATDRLFVRYWVKYSTNYVGSGKTYHPHEFNILSDRDQQFDGLSNNYLNVYIEQLYQNGGIPRLAVQDGKMIDVARVNTNLVGVTENRSVGGCNGTLGAPGAIDCYQVSTSEWYNARRFDASSVGFKPVAGADYKNNWNKVEVYFQLNTIVNGIGQANGIIRYWLNGALKIELTNVVFRTGANPNIKLRQFVISPWIGDGSPVQQTMWIDDLLVSTARDTTVTSPPTPTPAPVATVQITPTTNSLNVGQTLQLTATLRDSSGNVLTGRTVAWSSSVTSVATITSTGLVSAAGVGNSTVLAVSEGRNGTATVAVTTTPPVAGWPNEPAGFSLVTDYGFDDVLPTQRGGVPIGSTGWNLSQAVSSNGNAVRATDATAPKSPEFVSQINFPQGYTGGGEPAVFYRNIGGGNELYVGFYWKASSPWQNHPSGVNKIYFQMFGSGGQAIVMVWRDANRILLSTELPSEPFRNLEPNRTRTTIVPGRWYFIETTINKQTGLTKWWVDGVLNGEWTVSYPSSSFGEFQFAPTWGGLGGTKSTSDWYRLDHVRISKR